MLIYKVDNTTFGNDIPTLPQWAGPPRAMVHVQAILFASLASSLLSAFLAMLGKQWLNRYALTDKRGSAIERSQNRQRKLDGIVGWHFNPVMESLSLMLQAALLLLGCALSRYLWEINITIASVVLGVTSLGLLLYLSILVVGTALDSCPYQTPGSTFLRYIGPQIPRTVRSAMQVFGESQAINTIVMNARFYHPWWSEGNPAPFLRDLVNEIPPALATDARRLGQLVIQALCLPLATVHHLVRRVYNRLRGTSPTPEQGLEHQPTVLDLRCISWTLQTSLENPVHLSTLEYLVTITNFTNFESALIIDCFNIFVGYINITNGKVVIMRGSEQLATLSAMCLFQTVRHLSAIRPTSSVLAELHRRYSRIFPLRRDFRGLPFYHTMVDIHALVNQGWRSRFIRWTDYRPSNEELIPFARHMTGAAQAEYHQTQNKRVPRWILRFALHFLSLEPPPPISVIADCLTIIVIALDHDPSNAPIPGERYMQSVVFVSTVLTEVQCTGEASFKDRHSEA